MYVSTSQASALGKSGARSQRNSIANIHVLVTSENWKVERLTSRPLQQRLVVVEKRDTKFVYVTAVFIYRENAQIRDISVFSSSIMAPLSDYSEVKEDSPSSRLLSDNGYDNNEPLPTDVTLSRSTILLWALLLVVSLILTNIISFTLTYQIVTGTPKNVAEPPGGVAPLLRNLLLEPEPTRINTPFYDRENSIYRKHGSPETETAWRELTQLGRFGSVFG